MGAVTCVRFNSYALWRFAHMWLLVRRGAWRRSCNLFTRNGRSVLFSDQEQIHYMCGLSLACRPAILDGFGQKIARTMDSSPIGRDGGYAWFSCWYPMPFLQRYQPLWTVTVGYSPINPKRLHHYLYSWNQNRWGHSEGFWSSWDRRRLVGESCWKPSVVFWLVVWIMAFIFPYIGNIWECHHPNLRTHIFQRGGSTTHQL